MGYSTRRQARLPVLLVALLISGLSASGRVLQQSGGNTAQQLVSDGSDASTPQVLSLYLSTITALLLSHP